MHKVDSIPKLTAFVFLVGYLMGMDLSSLGVFLNGDEFLSYFGTPTPIEQGLLMGANPLGGLIGSIFYVSLAKNCARLYSFRLSTIIWLIGCFIGIFVLEIWMIAVARFLKGITIGMLSIHITNYINEVFPSNIRGRTLAFVQVGYTFSIFSMHYYCVGLNTFKSHYAFRLAWGLEFIPAVAVIIATFWIPESPVYLLRNTIPQISQKIDVMKVKHDSDSENDPADISDNIDDIFEFECTSRILCIREILKLKTRNRLLMGTILQVLVQFTGINVILYYITYICEMAGLKEKTKLLVSAVPYFINAVLSCFPLLYLDVVPRKLMTVIGSALLSTIMIAIAILMSTTGHEIEPIKGNKSLIWIVPKVPGLFILCLCFLFVGIYALSIACVPWIYTCELLPVSARAKGLPICMAIGWLMNFCITMTGPLLMQYLKWGVYLLFGSITLLLAFSVLLLFPETMIEKDRNSIKNCHNEDYSIEDIKTIVS